MIRYLTRLLSMPMGRRPVAMATDGAPAAPRYTPPAATPVPRADPDRELRLLASSEAMRHGLGGDVAPVLLAAGRAAYRRERSLAVGLATIRAEAGRISEDWDRVAAATGCQTWPRPVATNSHRRPIPRRRRTRPSSLPPPPDGDGPEVA